MQFHFIILRPAKPAGFPKHASGHPETHKLPLPSRVYSYHLKAWKWILLRWSWSLITVYQDFALIQILVNNVFLSCRFYIYKLCHPDHSNAVSSYIGWSIFSQDVSSFWHVNNASGASKSPKMSGIQLFCYGCLSAPCRQVSSFLGTKIYSPYLKQIVTIQWPYSHPNSPIRKPCSHLRLLLRSQLYSYDPVDPAI